MENLFKNSTEEKESALFKRLANYRLSIPHLGEERSRDDYIEDFKESFQVMREWFMGTPYRDSELSALSKETLDTIRRITKFAQRLAEQHQAFRSRKAEYLHLAKLFSELNDADDAHRLSAMVFGPAGGRHFYAESRETEDMNSHIEEEIPTEIQLKPRVNTYRERQRQTPIRDHSTAKEEARRLHLAEEQKLARLMKSLASDGIIDFENLPMLSRDARQMLLGWVVRAFQRNPIRTELGLTAELLYNSNSSGTAVAGLFW